MSYLLTLLMWGNPAVALLGTDLRQDLAGARRTFRRVYLVLDSDNAGIEATCRLQAQIGSTAVGVALPEGVKDVAELDEPPSLIPLKTLVAQRLRRVELPELLLEVQAWTGFASDFRCE